MHAHTCQQLELIISETESAAVWVIQLRANADRLLLVLCDCAWGFQQHQVKGSEDKRKYKRTQRRMAVGTLVRPETIQLIVYCQMPCEQLPCEARMPGKIVPRCKECMACRVRLPPLDLSASADVAHQKSYRRL